MKGIYKITNKLNGKSYIGQSIHCGKRLDEHLKLIEIPYWDYEKIDEKYIKEK